MCGAKECCRASYVASYNGRWSNTRQRAPQMRVGEYRCLRRVRDNLQLIHSSTPINPPQSSPVPETVWTNATTLYFFFSMFFFPSCNKCIWMYNFFLEWRSIDDPSMILTIPPISIFRCISCSNRNTVFWEAKRCGKLFVHRVTALLPTLDTEILTNHFLSNWIVFLSFLHLRFDAINATVLKNHPVTKHGPRNNIWIWCQHLIINWSCHNLFL